MLALVYVVAAPIVVAVQLCAVIVAFIMIGAGVRYLAERRAGVAKDVARERFRAAWRAIWVGDLRNVEPRYMLPILCAGLLCYVPLGKLLWIISMVFDVMRWCVVLFIAFRELYVTCPVQSHRLRLLLVLCIIVVMLLFRPMA